MLSRSFFNFFFFVCDILIINGYHSAFILLACRRDICIFSGTNFVLSEFARFNCFELKTDINNFPIN